MSVFSLYRGRGVTACACRDEVYQAIIDVLRSAGSAGILPRDVALELKRCKINPWNVTQRIRRMNKRLDRHIAKEVAEKRGILILWNTHAFPPLRSFKVDR